MNDYNDNSRTFKFKKIREEKEQQNRIENDVYSKARENNNVYEKEENTRNNVFSYVAVILATLLVVVLIAGIFILKNDSHKTNPSQQEENNQEENILVEIEKEEEKETETKEEKNIIIECGAYFYGDSIVKKNGEYTLNADLYDEDMYKFDNRKLILTGKTQIKESGKRITLDAFVYILENMAGEGLLYDCEINEEDNTLIEVSFEGTFLEESQEEETEEPPEDVTTPENGQEEITEETEETEEEVSREEEQEPEKLQ